MWSSYRARSLHPWFAIDLHRKGFLRRQYHFAALGQSSTRSSQPGPYLTHVQAIFQSNNFYPSITNIWNPNRKWEKKKKITNFRSDTGHYGFASHTLYGNRQIDRVETIGRQLFVRVFQLLPEGTLAHPLLRQVLAPQVRSAVGVGDIQQGNALQLGTVRQFQRDTVALRRAREKGKSHDRKAI